MTVNNNWIKIIEKDEEENKIIKNFKDQPLEPPVASGATGSSRIRMIFSRRGGETFRYNSKRNMMSKINSGVMQLNFKG